MKIQVEVYDEDADKLIKSYVMNHDNPAERKVLGEQCRNAFEAWQTITTFRVLDGHREKETI